MTGFKNFDRFDFDTLIGGLLFTLMCEQSIRAAITSLTIWVMFSIISTFFRRPAPLPAPVCLKPSSRGGFGSMAIRHERARPRRQVKTIRIVSPPPPVVLGPAPIVHLAPEERFTYAPSTYKSFKDSFDPEIAKKQAQARISEAMNNLRAAGHHSIEMEKFRTYCLSIMRTSEFEEGIRALNDMRTLTRHTIHGPSDTILLLNY